MFVNFTSSDFGNGGALAYNTCRVVTRVFSFGIKGNGAICYNADRGGHVMFAIFSFFGADTSVASS